MAVAAFGFGAFGLWRYESAPENGGHPDPSSIFYHTLQLFILHAPHLEHHVPWQLHLGRLLAAAFYFAAAATVLGKVFRDEALLMRLWLPWRRNHVVVCGLGDLGLRLALSGRRRRRFVVAIEKNPAPDALERARSKGVLVLDGEASEAEQLRRARVERADFLVAASQEDLTNVAIASAASELGRKAKKNEAPLVCHLLIRDRNLRQRISDEALFTETGSGYRVNSSEMDLDATIARQALRRYPLDFKPIHTDDETVVCMVVIGFGQVGQRLARQAARVGHFANEVGKNQKRLRLTVVDRDNPVEWEAFQQRCENVCETSLVKLNPDDADFASKLFALFPGDDAGNILITYALCLQDEEKTGSDRINLDLGFELAKLGSKVSAQVLIHQTTKSADYSALFSPVGHGAAFRDRVHAFGMEEDMFSWNSLFLEDQVARTLHENYRSENPATEHPVWDNLSAGYKDSNRQAADHIPVKLRAIGCRIDHLKRWKPRVEQFDHREMDLLARMEHARWCAERYLDGWQYGTPTDRARKINDCLLPWDRLRESDKKKDWGQIKAIPRILKSVGLGIYRMEN